MLTLLDTFCGPQCFLRTASSEIAQPPTASIKILLFATGCLYPHIVTANTDTYLGIDSVWNINVNRWLGDKAVRLSDYSENSFGVRGGTGLTSLTYRYTARFLPQDIGQGVNDLFTSLCCGDVGVWYGNFVLCAHEFGTGERLAVSWNTTSRNFEWTEDVRRSSMRKAKDMTIDEVPHAVYLLTQ